jgi:hypothetical protein
MDLNVSPAMELGTCIPETKLEWVIPKADPNSEGTIYSNPYPLEEILGLFHQAPLEVAPASTHPIAGASQPLQPGSPTSAPNSWPALEEGIGPASGKALPSKACNKHPPNKTPTTFHEVEVARSIRLVNGKSFGAMATHRS